MRAMVTTEVRSQRSKNSKERMITLHQHLLEPTKSISALELLELAQRQELGAIPATYAALAKAFTLEWQVTVWSVRIAARPLVAAEG